MRRDRSVAWISRAVRVIAPTGRSTRPERIQPTPRLATNRPASTINEYVRNVCRVL
jgi:hypothetical protein